MRTPAALLFLAIMVTTSNGQWVYTKGPTGTTLGGLAADPAGHVYAVSDSQWFRSTNDGATWDSIPIWPSVWAGGRFCIGRANKLFAGTWRGISQSSRFGETWEPAALVDTGITALYAGTDGTVYAGIAPTLPANTWKAMVVRSTDDGMSWVQCSPTWAPSTVEAIAATPQGVIFAALISHITLNGSIVRSPDAGLHWDTAYQCGGDTMIHALAVGPDGTIFAGTATPDFGSGAGGKVLRSTNNGQTWTSLQTGLPQAAVWSFLFTGSGRIFVSTLATYTSTNNGTTWTSATAGLPQVPVYALACNASTLFAGTGERGIWRRPLSNFTSVEEPPPSRPVESVLFQNYPNPFNPVTTIGFRVAAEKHGSGSSSIDNSPLTIDNRLGSRWVRLVVYDMLGREVSMLVDERREAGDYEVKFDGAHRAGGVYLYRLQVRPLDSAVGRDSKSGAGDFTQTRKFVLLK